MPPSPSLIGWDALGGAFVATKDQGSLAGQGGESRYRRRGGADGPPPTCAELHTSSRVEGSSGCIERSERSMQGGQTWVVSISRPSVKPRSSHSRTRNLGSSSAGIGPGPPPTRTTRSRLLGAGSGCPPGVRSRVVCQVGGLSGTLPLTFAAKRDLIRQAACHDPVVGP